MELNEEDFFFFHFYHHFFISAQPAPILDNADLLYNRSRLRQNAQHISCTV